MSGPAFIADVPVCPTPPDADSDLLQMWVTDGRSHERDGRGDTEDWTEAAFRLQIAIRAGMDTEAVVDGNTEDGTPIWGPLSRWSPVTTAQEQLAQRYSYTATFADSAVSGRQTFLTDPARFAQIVATIGAGHKVWFKSLSAKTYIGRMDFTGYDTVCDGDVLDKLIATGDEWMLVHLPQHPGILMVYREVPMEFEYRMFVVNSRIVTGAGCIEDATPLDNTDRLDPALRRIRKDESCGLETRPDLAVAYERFAEDQVLERFAEEGLNTFVIDLAMSEGRPIVIELNGMLKSGLYAIDTNLLGAAVVANPSQFAARRTR